jgi:hypothetical protein
MVGSLIKKGIYQDLKVLQEIHIGQANFFNQHIQNSCYM